MRRMRFGGFTLIELLVVITIIGLLAALLLPAITKSMCSSREGAAKVLINQLHQACKMYEGDQNQYPPGDGKGSKKLVEALTKKAGKQHPYFEFQDDMLTGPKGDVINPVWASAGGDDKQIIHYRRSKGFNDADAKNKSSVDLWAADCDENAKGVNNWE